MKKNFTILCIILLLFSGKSWSQESEEEEGFEGKNLTSMHANTDWFKLMNQEETNLFEVKKAYDDYFVANPFVKSKETRAYEFWTRHVVGSNYDSNGNVGKQDINTDDLIKKASTRRVLGATANWSRIMVTPDMDSNWGSGCYTQGTCNMLAINPSDSNQMIAGFIDGGTLWRTTDNGISWTQVGTNLLTRSFGTVVYSKSNPSIVYAGSSSGISKSTDGGATWSMTPGYNNIAAYPTGDKIWAMEVKADDPNTVLFAVGPKVYKTVDGGVTWTTITMGTDIRDIRALPSTPNVVFATVKNGTWYEVRRSTDFGTTWAAVTNGYPTSISGYTGELALLAVSPAAPNNVWVHLICKQTATAASKTYDIYKSTDGGLTFSRMNIAVDLTDDYWQATWNEAFAISDTDPNIMATGAFDMHITTNGGVSWTESPGTNSKYGPHSDIHGIVIKGNTIYYAGDGGVGKSTDNGQTYDNTIDNGIQSQTIWGFDQGWKSDIMAIGMYHGPTTFRDDSVYAGWYPSSGADAGEAFVNKGDDRYIYAHPWGNSRFIRSADRMIKPKTIAITQINKGKNEMNDPDYYEKVYGSDTNKLYESTSNGASFEQKKVFEANVNDYIVALTNNKIIYARAGNFIYKTVDGGTTWVNVSPTTISAGKSISHIAVDGSNPSVIWVAFGAKQSVVKVVKSTDGGATWVNYSGTALPSYAINCIANQMGTNGGVYIGTDAGVYYRNNSMSDWVPFNTNLPTATQVGWIKISYAKEKIRMAGQTGIWESDLYSDSTPIAHPTTSSFIAEAGKPVQFADMSVCLANATYSWSFPGGTPSTSTLEKPVVKYADGGDKTVSLTVTDENGTDSRTYTNFIRVRPVGDIAKTGWTVQYYDSQQNSTDQAAALAIDNNPSTIWHTAWSGVPGYPHDIQIDMHSTVSIESFKYMPRQDGGVNGTVKGYEWYVSNDGINWGEPLLTGNYVSDTGEKISTLSTPVSARYFRFRPTSEINAKNYASAAEIGINGSTSVIAAFETSKTLVVPGGTINFADKTAGNPTSWSWSFPGGTPATSTEQNPVVTYATPGIYSVTLKVSSDLGTDIITKSGYVNVNTFVPQAGWSLKYADSEEMTNEKTPATNAFDGSNSTIWGTKWSVTPRPAYPHELQIDMGANYTVNGFNYVPRQNSSNGRIKDFEFYVSTDGINWTLTNSGTWANDAAEKSYNFPPVSVRYIRLKALTENGTTSTATVAEIKMKLVGESPVVDFKMNPTAVLPIQGQSFVFTDLSTNTPTSWNWTFTGATPSTSTSQNPTVKYDALGSYTVTLTATNATGSSTVTKTVIVADQQPPVVPTLADVNLGECSGTPVAPTTTDNFAGTVAGTTQTVFPITSQGTTAVTWTFDDGRGNISTASQNIIVDDVTAPVPNLQTLATITGECSATVTAPEATDNCAGTIIGTTTDATTYTAQGTYTVHWTFNDGNGNISNQDQTVIVKDTTAPILECPKNIILSACQSTATWSLPVANDNCSDVVITQTQGPASGSEFANGTTSTISYEAKDAGGNVGNCSFTVTRQQELDVTVSNSNPELYYGFAADQSSTITGTPKGGTAPYTVSITMNRPLKSNVITSEGDEKWTAGANTYTSSNIICPETGSLTLSPVSTSINNLTENDTYGVAATLMAKAEFIITVTDANGCSVSKTTTLYAEDARCFAGNSSVAKVKICHQTGNSKDPYHELCVDLSAVQTHLNHGDSLGTCASRTAKSDNQGKMIVESSSFNVKTYPNPSDSMFTLVLESDSNERAEVSVYDMSGRLVKKIEKGNGKSVVFGKELAKGEYLALVRQGSNVKAVKLIKK